MALHAHSDKSDNGNDGDHIEVDDDNGENDNVDNDSACDTYT